MMAATDSAVAFIGIALCCISLSFSEEINISNVTELEMYLCHTKLSSNTLLYLNPGDDFVLNFKLFCAVSEIHNIGIIGKGQQHVNINCSTPIGFGFFSISNFTIKNIAFINCGRDFNNSVPQLPRTAPLYLSETSAAVLLFMNCSDVIIDSVDISQYYGYAMVMLRVTGQFIVKNVTIADSHNLTKYNIGSGVLLYHYDASNKPTSDNSKINISDVHIRRSLQVSIHNILCLADVHISNKSQDELQTAGGISLIYSQTHYNATTSISHSSVEECGAVGLGGMLILHIDGAMCSTTIIENCRMHKNYIPYNPLQCDGANLGIYYVTTGRHSQSMNEKSLLMINSEVQSHHHVLKKTDSYIPSTIYIMLTYLDTVKIIFSNVTFKFNRASKTGVCIYVIDLHSVYASTILCYMTLKLMITTDMEDCSRPVSLHLSLSTILPFQDQVLGQQFFRITLVQS